MIPISLARILRIVCAVVLIALIAPCVPAADPPKTLKFPGLLSVLQVEPGHVYATTKDGLYQSNGELTRWTAVYAWPAISSGWLVGGTAKGLWITISDKQTSQDSTVQLCLYQEPSRLTFIRRIPDQPAEFASDSLGAYASGGTLIVTTDKGATWSDPHPVFNQEQGKIWKMQWLNAETLIVSSQSHDVALLEVARDGLIKQRWLTKPPTGPNSFAQDADVIWTGASPIVALDKNTGKPVQTVQTSEELNMVLRVYDDRLFVGGTLQTGVWPTKQKDPALRTADIASARWVLPMGSGKVVLATLEGKFVLWDGKSPAGTPLSLEIDKTAIDTAIAAAAPADGRATPEEVRTMSQWALKVGLEGQREAIRRGGPALQALSPRQKVLWLTAEYQRIFAERQKAAASQPASQPK